MSFFKKQFLSFGYAFKGIVKAFRRERNMKIHICATFLVVVFGVWLSISVTEWLVCLLCIAMVFSAEMMNTAIEAAADFMSYDRNPSIGFVKDVAAGAVLITAIVSAVVGMVIFLPKIFEKCIFLAK